MGLYYIITTGVVLVIDYYQHMYLFVYLLILCHLTKGLEMRGNVRQLYSLHKLFPQLIIYGESAFVRTVVVTFQNGEHRVRMSGRCADSFHVCRVSILPSTTSRRATVPPPRARIPTCSCSSRCVAPAVYADRNAEVVQLYRFLARRTDSDFNKVRILLSLNI